MDSERVAVIITAGGISRRYGGDMPKQFLLLNGKPVLTRAVSVFDGLRGITDIVVTVPPGYIEKTRAEVIAPYGIKKVTQIIEGGGERQASVYKALLALPPETDIVLVHDGVRPFVTTQTIRTVIDRVRQGYAAVAGTKTTDTVKITDADGRVMATPNRETLWNAQTPQGFAYKTLLHAHEAAAAEGFTGTDDASLVERERLAPVIMVDGGRHNIKITTPGDLAVGELLHKDWL